MGPGELRADVVHEVGHPPEDGVGHGLRRVAPRGLVAVDLLDPLEIDDGHDADEKVGIACHVHLVGGHSAVQPLVEQEVRFGRNILPRRECAGRLLVRDSLFIVVEVLAVSATAVDSVVAEQRLKLFEQVGGGTEMAEGVVARRGLLGHPLRHRGAVVAVEGIPSTKAAPTFSRRKICWKMRDTEVVPAPEDPVTAMMGWSAGMGELPQLPFRNRPREAKSGASNVRSLWSR